MRLLSLLLTLLTIPLLAGCGSHANHQTKPSAHHHTNGMGPMEHGEHTEQHGTGHMEEAVLPGGRLQLLAFPARPGIDRTLKLRLLQHGKPIRGLEISHERRLHLFLVSSDLRHYQHLHPQPQGDSWQLPVQLPQGGHWRVYAQFSQQGMVYTLSSSRHLPGTVAPWQLPAVSEQTRVDGFQLQLQHHGDQLRFSVQRAGKPVALQAYLGAFAHVVVVDSAGGLQHLHDAGAQPEAGQVHTAQPEPTSAPARLFLQFRTGGQVHTAAWTLNRE